jgi:hypothetical protein
MIDSTTCNKCGEDAYVVDPAEGFLVCEACGYMPEPDADPLQSEAMTVEGQQMGVYVPHGNNVAIGGVGLGPSEFRHLAPKSDTLEAHRRYLQERSKHFANSLMLPR